MTLGELEGFGFYGGFPLGGMTIIESPFLTKEEQEIVPRTWRERLFTRPWRLFEKTKTVTVRVPDPDLYSVAGMVYGHPVTVARLRESLALERIADRK